MKKKIKTKHYNFSDFLEKKEQLDTDGQISRMYLDLYERVRAKEFPTILELGTNKGISTLMFLQSCLENKGKLFSVDIEDYSDLTDMKCWTFIQSDSTDIKSIVNKAPLLKEGIDVLLIDSLHKRSHVEKEFWGWAPYLNEGALIIFDDVDPHIYGQNQRKDNVFHEFDWEDIRRFVEEVFYANEGTLSLEMHYGSTGFAIMKKISDKNIPLQKNKSYKQRTRSVFWRSYIFILQKFTLMKGRIKNAKV